jgi:hypothetical protein
MLLVSRIVSVLLAAFFAWGAISALRLYWPVRDRAGIAHVIAQLTLSIGILAMLKIDYRLYGVILVLIGLVGMRIRTLTLKKSQSSESQEFDSDDGSDASEG